MEEPPGTPGGPPGEWVCGSNGMQKCWKNVYDIVSVIFHAGRSKFVAKSFQLGVPKPLFFSVYLATLEILKIELSPRRELNFSYFQGFKNRFKFGPMFDPKSNLSSKSLGTPQNVDFSISNVPTWDPLTFNCFEKSSENRVSGQRIFRQDPRGPHEAPKRFPTGVQEAPRGPKRPPRGLRIFLSFELFHNIFD